MKKMVIDKILSENGIIGTLVKIVALNPHTINDAKISVYDVGYKDIITSEAKSTNVGYITDIKSNYVTLVSNWVEFQEKIYLGEVHKVIRADILSITRLISEDGNENN